jgi:transcriptional regulator with XRE-family HTH domain
MATMISKQEALNNISANLRRFMRKRGMTQVKLAQQTGDSQQVISALCNAKYSPAIDFMARVAEALDVTVDMLLAPPPAAPIQTTPQNISDNFSHTA